MFQLVRPVDGYQQFGVYVERVMGERAVAEHEDLDGVERADRRPDATQECDLALFSGNASSRVSELVELS